MSVRAGVYWFADEGWVIDFFVAPKEDFPQFGQPILEWCIERGIDIRDDGIGWESRIEMIAVHVPEDVAMEFKLRWDNTHQRIG